MDKTVNFVSKTSNCVLNMRTCVSKMRDFALKLWILQVAIDPVEGDHAINMGHALQNAGRHSEAKESFQRAVPTPGICIHNRSHNLHLILGLNYACVFPGAGRPNAAQPGCNFILRHANFIQLMILY